jgi:hypothetical protein
VRTATAFSINLIGATSGIEKLLHFSLNDNAQFFPLAAVLPFECAP